MPAQDERASDGSLRAIASFQGHVKLLHRENEFKRIVVEAYSDLPRQQQLVADFMLDHLQEIPLLSVPELANRCGASEATIVRFAQRIGYDGFSSLKADLLEAVREKVLPGAPPWAAFTRVPQGDTFDAVAQQEVANIQRSIGDVDRAQAEAAADALFEADTIYWYGMGISAHLASMGSYLLTQIGLRSHVLAPSFSSPLEPLITLRPNDAVVVLSFPPYSRGTLQVLETAVARGATTLAVTDRATAPAASIAKHALPVRSENMMYTNSFAAISVLLNGLVTTIAVRHPQEVAASVEEISAVLERSGELTSTES